MMPMSEGQYRIDQTRRVVKEIRNLTARATALGIRQEFFQAWHSIIEQLRSRPVEWGDPQWRIRKPGGSVCHGIASPLFVQFVVYEEERAVCILAVKAVPGSALD
jgi:hypothetical protein